MAQRLNIGQIEAMLNKIKPHAEVRESWLAVGYALRTELGDGGFSLFVDWSQTGTYKETEKHLKLQWDSFVQHTSFGVVVKMVQQEIGKDGYIDLLKDYDDGSYKVDEVKLAEQQKEQAKIRAKSAQQVIAAKTMRAKKCNASYLAIKSNIETSIYLQTKGFNVIPNGCHVTKSISSGLFGYSFSNSSSEFLTVPIYSLKTSKMCSLQVITAESVKMFASGTATEYGVYKIEGNSTYILCEGLATGLTLREATGATVLVCFSKYNIKKVADLVAANRSDVSDYFLAFDRDIKKGNGKTAQELASELAVNHGYGKFTAPNIGKDWNDEGTDFTYESWIVRHTKDITINEKYLGDHIGFALDHNSALVVNSDLGTGKTYSFRSLAQVNESVLYLVPRITLANDVSQSLGLTNYQDENYNSGRLVVTPNSARSKINRICAYDLIVIDEIETFSSAFASGAMSDKEENIKFIRETIMLSLKYGGKLVCLDAHNSSKTESILKSLGIIRYGTLSNSYKPYDNFTCHTHDDAKTMRAKLNEDLKAGLNVIVSCSSKAMCEKIYADTDFVSKKDKVLVTSETSGHYSVVDYVNDPSKFTTDKIQLIIHSPSMGTGVSIDGSFYDTIYHFAMNTVGTGNVFDTFQALGRVRTPNLKEWHVCIDSSFNRLRNISQLNSGYNQILGIVNSEEIDSDSVNLAVNEITNKSVDYDQKNGFRELFDKIATKKGANVQLFLATDTQKDNACVIKEVDKDTKMNLKMDRSAKIELSSDISEGRANNISRALESKESKKVLDHSRACLDKYILQRTFREVITPENLPDILTLEANKTYHKAKFLLEMGDHTVAEKKRARGSLESVTKIMKQKNAVKIMRLLDINIGGTWWLHAHNKEFIEQDIQDSKGCGGWLAWTKKNYDKLYSSGVNLPYHKDKLDTSTLSTISNQLNSMGIKASVLKASKSKPERLKVSYDQSLIGLYNYLSFIGIGDEDRIDVKEYLTEEETKAFEDKKQVFSAMCYRSENSEPVKINNNEFSNKLTSKLKRNVVII